MSPSEEAWAAMYRALVRRCRSEDLLGVDPGLYTGRITAWVGLLSLCWALLLLGPAWPIRALLLLAATIAGVQCGMIGHDAGHGQISERKAINQRCGHLCMTVAIGYAWNHWRLRHDAHHQHPNEVGLDPDLQGEWFALVPGQIPTPWARRWLVPRQHLLLWPLLSLFAVLIRIRTTIFALTDPGATRWDRLGLALQYALWLGLPLLFLPASAVLLNYACWTWGLGVYFSVSFVWNHLGADSMAPGERMAPFAQRLRCSRSLRGGPWVSLLFGGLDHHVEHHLLPRVPTARLPAVRRVLRELLAEAGVPFAPMSWGEAMAEVSARWRAMSSATSPSPDPPPAAPASSPG